MKAITNYRSEKSRYIISALCVVVLMLLTFAILQIRFETNDDAGIMYIVAGYNTGTPSPLTLFTNIIFGYLLSGLYTLIPIIPWYGITHIFLIFISLTMILKSLIKVCVKREAPIVVPFVIFFFLYIFFMLYYTAALQFSTTPAIAGAAACVLTASLYFDESIRARVVDCIAIVSLLFFSYIIRSESGFVVLCYFATVLIFIIAKFIASSDRNIKQLRTLVLLCVCTVVLLISATIFDTYKDERKGMTEYRSFYKQLSGYIDLRITPYSEAPELYANIGWDSNLQSLVNNWFFMDERVTEENFAIINEYNEAIRQSLSFSNRIKTDTRETVLTIGRLFSRDNYAVGATLVYILIFALHSILLIRQKN